MKNFKKLLIWQKGMDWVIRFLEYSLGSACELETHIIAGDMLNYGDKGLTALILSGIKGERKMIQGFISKVGGS